MNNLLMAYSAALRWQQAIHCWQGKEPDSATKPAVQCLIGI